MSQNEEAYNNNVNEDDSRRCLKDDHKLSKGTKRGKLHLNLHTDDDDNNNKRHIKHQTVNAEDVELVCREPYILSGYRLPNQPWRYYLVSLFWVHNETVNVWTHLIGCLLLVAHAVFLGLRLDNFRDSRAGLMIAFAVACFVSNLFSSLAHLLHAKSAKHHYILYSIDYAGICVYNFGNGIDALYSCSTRKQYVALKPFFLPVLVIGCYISFLAILVARLKFQGTKYERRRKVVMTSIYLVLMGFISWPIVARYVRCFGNDDCKIGSLNHITFIFVGYAVMGISFTALLPEKLRPGRFDLWGHSHQWFHVLVMVTQQLQLYALHVDYVQRGRARHVTTTLSSLLITLGLLMAMQMVTIKLMVPSIEKKVEKGCRLVCQENATKMVVISSSATAVPTIAEDDAEDSDRESEV